MKIGGFSKFISTMFTDKMNINRYTDEDNTDGSTDTVLSEKPIYSDVPCRISFIGDEKPNDYEVDDVPIKNTPKLFFSVDVDIRAGDRVVVKRFNDNGQVIATYSGKVGLPLVFITHKEALFNIEESA